jgi:xanthine/uracil/vitamin C permease (AzgA family)
VLNPILLATDELEHDAADVLLGSAVAAAFAMIAVGVVMNKPYCIVPAMGTNTYIAVLCAEKQSSQVMAAIVIEGIILVLLSVSGGMQWLAQAGQSLTSPTPHLTPSPCPSFRAAVHE